MSRWGGANDINCPTVCGIPHPRATPRLESGRAHRHDPPQNPLNTDDRATRRVDLTLHKPWFALYWGIKPTVVVDGRGHPAQWGVGTWQAPADQTVTLGVFLFNRMWRFGRAELAVEPHQAPALVYRAPALPFLPGSIRAPQTKRSQA